MEIVNRWKLVRACFGRHASGDLADLVLAYSGGAPCYSVWFEDRPVYSEPFLQTYDTPTCDPTTAVVSFVHLLLSKKCRMVTVSGIEPDQICNYLRRRDGGGGDWFFSSLWFRVEQELLKQDDAARLQGLILPPKSKCIWQEDLVRDQFLYTFHIHECINGEEAEERFIGLDPMHDGLVYLDQSKERWLSPVWDQFCFALRGFGYDPHAIFFALLPSSSSSEQVEEAKDGKVDSEDEVDEQEEKVKRGNDAEGDDLGERDYWIKGATSTTTTTGTGGGGDPPPPALI